MAQIVSGPDDARDGIAFARAIGCCDLEGAWAVFGNKTPAEHMALAIFLAANLYRVVGDDDGKWLALLEDADNVPLGVIPDVS
jgi:hypothetical protein